MSQGLGDAIAIAIVSSTLARSWVSTAAAGADGNEPDALQQAVRLR